MEMYSQITGEVPLAALTVSQFIELLNKGKSPEPPPASQPADHTHGVVHGIRGIRQLLGVSHATACRLKATVLRPAVRQNGRIIVTDVAKALELFDEYKK
jgi:hypothetical protein